MAVLNSCAVSSVTVDSVSKAVFALINHLRRLSKQRKAQLLEYDDFLYLVLTLKRIPATSRLNPHLLPLPHPIYGNVGGGHSPSLCLFLDDRHASSSLSPPEALERARTISLPLEEAIGLSSLRADYRAYEARRRLCDSHDLFFADRRIIPLLPRLIGKHFFKKKKIPFAVDLSRPGWPEQIRRCLKSAPLYLRSGTCCALRVGRVSMEEEEIVDNAMAAIREAMEYVPKKWGNVRSVHVKAVDSVALPIYQAVPEISLKIEVPKKKKILNSHSDDAEGEVVDVGDDQLDNEVKEQLKIEQEE